MRFLALLDVFLLAVGVYEDQYLVSEEELLNTRPGVFMWSSLPLLFRGSSHQISIDQGPLRPSWETSCEVPLTNPSIQFLSSGEMILSLRLSNSPGCPCMQESLFNSENSGHLRNEAVLATAVTTSDKETIKVTSFAKLEIPSLLCLAHFEKSFKSDGRVSNLERVTGPMDIRIYAKDDVLWSIFYCERNLPDGDIEIVNRGMVVAPIHIDISGGGLQRAWILESEVLFVSPQDDVIEKNWQILDVLKTSESGYIFHLQCALQPNYIVTVSVSQTSTQALQIETISGSNRGLWPESVIFHSFNVRGGYCCVKIKYSLVTESSPQFNQSKYVAITDTVLLGIGHMMRIRNPPTKPRGEEMIGNITRLRSLSQTRVYTQFLYLLDKDYEMVGVSEEFFMGLAGKHSPRGKRGIIAESIQFASGIAIIDRSSSLQTYSNTSLLRPTHFVDEPGDLQLWIAYGINDCEASIVKVALYDALSIIKPVI